MRNGGRLPLEAGERGIYQSEVVSVLLCWRKRSGLGLSITDSCCSYHVLIDFLKDFSICCIPLRLFLETLMISFK